MVVFDLRAERPVRFVGHSQYAYFVAVSPDDSIAVSADPHGTDLRLWDVLTGDPLGHVDQFQGVLGLQFDTDSDRVIAISASDGDYEARTVDVDTLKVGTANTARTQGIVEWARETGPMGLGDWIAWGEDAEAPWILRPTRDGVSVIGRTPRGETVRIGDEAGSLHGFVYGATVSPDEERVALAYSDGTVAILELESGRSINTWSGHFGPAYAVAFSPDGTRLATGGNDATVMLWDVRGGHAELTAKLRGHDQYVRGLTFSHDGTRILSASGDKTLRVWDTLPSSARYREIAARRTALRAATSTDSTSPR